MIASKKEKMPGWKRLIVNLNHLRVADRELAEGVLRDPFKYVPALEAVLKDEVLNMEPGYLRGGDGEPPAAWLAGGWWGG